MGSPARSAEDLWRIFNAAPLRMQVLDRLDDVALRWQPEQPN